MADRPSPPVTAGSLALRILLGAAVLFVVVSIVGWLIGAVLSLVRTLAVIAAVVAVVWIIVAGTRR